MNSDILKMKDKDKESGSDLSTTSNDRFVYINGTIDDDKAKDVIEKLLELQAENPLEEITMIISSVGGGVYPMFAIADMMEMGHMPIKTVCLGAAQSAAAFIFVCGTKGKRFMAKHSSLMIHQVSGGTFGTMKDIDVQVNEIKYLQEEMIKELADKSNLSAGDIKKFIDRDFFIRPQQAIEYGFCDGVIGRLS